ncbi:MAG: glucose-6-phosphate dehydrogenase assembly protein OpcA [Acidimicrobiales bacterium]
MTGTGSALPDGSLVDSWRSEDTRFEPVVAELARMRADAEIGATRAAVVNLVVLAAADAGATRAVDSVVGLGRHHPGRIIVIVPRDGADDDDRMAGGLELYCSQVEDRYLWWDVVRLEIGGPVAGHAESLVEPLLLHDLPVALWLAGGTSRVDSPGLLDLAAQLIVSGERAASISAHATAEDLAGLVRGKPLSDLAWVATEPARQALARLFDAPERRELLAAADGLRVEGPPWSSRLLAGWFCERTGLAPDSVEIVPGDDLRAEVRLGSSRAELEAGPVWPAGRVTTDTPEPPGSGPGVAVARLGPTRVSVSHGGSATRRLLTSALSRPWRDRRYEAALDVAGRLGR